MKTSKRLSLVLAILMMVSLILAPSALADDTITINFLLTASEGLPVSQYLKQAMDAVTEKSGGKIQWNITYSASSVFAGEGEMLDMVKSGSADMANVSPTYFNSVADEIDVLAWPYVFESGDHIFNFFASDASKGLLDKIETASGVKLVTAAYMGIRNMTTKGIEVRSPKDLEGVKIRCMGSTIYVNGTNAMGATAIPIAYSELYFSLQTGVAEGQENQMSVIEESKLYEVQDTICKTEHLYTINFFIGNSKFWDSLPDEYKTLIDEEFDKFASDYAGKVNAIDDEYEAQFSEMGMKIIKDVDKAAFVEKCGAEFSKLYADQPSWLELYDAIKSCA